MKYRHKTSLRLIPVRDHVRAPKGIVSQTLLVAVVYSPLIVIRLLGMLSCLLGLGNVYRDYHGDYTMFIGTARLGTSGN